MLFKPKFRYVARHCRFQCSWLEPENALSGLLVCYSISLKTNPGQRTGSTRPRNDRNKKDCHGT